MDIGQNLYNLLKCSNHPLERYILAIDSNLENDSLLRTIGERIGIDLYYEEDANVGLYLKLKEYLENETSVLDTRNKINISLKEYSKQFPNLSEEEILPYYYNRLLI